MVDVTNVKPVTAHASIAGVVTPLQQEGLGRVLDYLELLHPGPLLPLTGRIIIEWGDEEALEELREC